MKKLIPTLFWVSVLIFLTMPSIYTNLTSKWHQTGPIMVVYNGGYFPTFMRPNSEIFRVEMCSGYMLNGIKSGMTIDLRYREANEFIILNSKCWQFENYRIVSEK